MPISVDAASVSSGRKENKTVCLGVHPHVCVAEEEDKKDEKRY
jgi:hypothetical protein